MGVIGAMSPPQIVKQEWKKRNFQKSKVKVMSEEFENLQIWECCICRAWNKCSQCDEDPDRNVSQCLHTVKKEIKHNDVYVGLQNLLAVHTKTFHANGES